MGRSIRVRWRSAIMSEKGPPTPAERLVAIAMAEFMNAEGSGAFPSERTLGKCTGLYRSKVHDAVENLVKNGWLAVVGKPGRGRYGSALRTYSATFPKSLNGLAREPLCDSANGSAQEPISPSSNGSSIAQVTNSIGSRTFCNGSSIEPDPENQMEPEGEGIRPLGFLTGERRAMAADIAPGVDPVQEWSAFCDWHLAKGRKVVDVNAAWRNWLRKCNQFRRTGCAHSTPVSAKERPPPTAEEIRREYIKAAAENEATLARAQGGR